MEFLSQPPVKEISKEKLSEIALAGGIPAEIVKQLHVSGGLREFQNHLSRRHDAPFHCSEDDCERRKFTVKKSLFRHLREHHPVQCEPSSSESSSSETDSDVSSSRSSLLSNNENGSLLDGERDELSGLIAENVSEELNNGEHNIFGGLNDMELNNSNEDHDSNSGNDAHSNVDSEVESDFELETPLDAKLQRAAARFLLDIRRRGNVTGVAITDVIEATQEFLNAVTVATKEKIAENMRNSGVDADLIEQCLNDVVFYEPFKSLKTKEQQINYFKDHFNYVAPQSKHLGYRNDIQINNQGVPVPVQVKLSFQYISMKEILRAVLNNKVYFKLIHAEKKSTDGKLRSFLDGSLADEHPLVSEYPFTIRITLHVDDVDCVNPLGSKTGIHKITEVQFQIQNLPPQENARLRSVFVLAYAYREDLAENGGVDALLEPLFLELQDLETPDGVEIEVNGRPYTLRVTLVAGAADAAAAHEILGLYSCSASRFCSLCTIQKKDLIQDIFAQGEPRTKELHQFHMEELAEKSEKFVRENYGVMRRSTLFEKSVFAEFPEAFQKDGMHDILRGLAPMEIKLVLHEMCLVKKYFQVSDFNNRIRSFNVGPADLKNKPSPNFTIDSVKNKGSYTIHQSAAQTWCLLQIFPFLVADKVPLDDPHLKLIVLLKRISVMIFSFVISDEVLQGVDNLIHEHHQLFFLLYPPHNPGVEEETEDVDDLDSENFDNIPDDPEDWENYLLDDSTEANDENEPNNLETGVEEVEPVGGNEKRKKPKKIRPINKHHHLYAHYVNAMRKYGPAVLYWCMRFEGKHALPKRKSAIVACFKNIPLTYADIQQTNQCAELLDLKVEASKELFLSSNGNFVAAGDTPYFEGLSAHGVMRKDALEEVKQVTISGFLYEAGLYLNLQLNSEVPIFGLITDIFVQEEVFIVTEDCKGFYDDRFGAFRIEKEENSTVRVLTPDLLSGDRPMAPWTVDYETYYISPRRTLA